MRIRARRFLQPGSLQAQEDWQELQLARQAMGSAPRLQEGRSRVLLWLEKRHRRMRNSWQRKYERLGGRAAVWMVCTVEPWLARVQGRAPEQEQVKKQQDEVKNRRRLSPQEGYSWDVYPTLGAVLEEKLEFESAAARAGQGAVPEADAFEASRLGVGDLQERQKRRAPAAASSARAAAEARALQDMQAALQRRQQWQLVSL
ncbi:hypothetical protein OEZ85_013929 [Tetradesmus obliquus]|uniref:Uncharacterized protein n=1 Tax=Tetradesmus obliquus TaxID=3088 RepID=A0ABY8U6L7_TETOB|nr:hypothetical protein OEZ85_013929 [Tetradesmus obliquus]